VEPAPHLDASRPSGLRLLAFGLSAAGALVIGIGAVLDWVTVGFRGQVSLETTEPGTDLTAGRIALVCAVVILISIVVSRLALGGARKGLAALIIAAAAIAVAAAAWFLGWGKDRYTPVDSEALVNQLAAYLGASVEQIRSQLASVVDQLGAYTHVGPGPWVVIGGGILALAGGVATLRWAIRIAAPVDLPPH
jgi:hypothetical protein